MSMRSMCFTINNFTVDEENNVNELKNLLNWDQYQYIIAGREVGDSGTPHIQGFCQFKAPKKFNTIKKKLPTAHIEQKSPNSTPEQAAEYCKKDGDYQEWGEMTTQGKRTDIEACTEMITSGAKLRSVAKAHPVQYVKYYKGFQALKTILIEPRIEVPTVIVLYGKTGTGKSRKARELTNDPYVWGPEQLHWFDGYEGQKDCIFEEFRGQLPLGTMLRLLDRYDCKVQYKGGMVEFAATKIVITSPKHPLEWYEDSASDKIDQLMRRISETEHLE